MFAKTGVSRLRSALIGVGGLSIYATFNHHQNLQATKCDRADSQKIAAGYKTVDDCVKSNMTIGLGGGRAVQFALSRLGQRVSSGDLKNLTTVPASDAVMKQCISLGIRTIPFSELRSADLTIDSVDEVDSDLNVIKGSNGSFSNEKKLHKASKQVIFLCDENVLTKNIGPGSVLPVEVATHIENDVLKNIESLQSMKGAYPIFRRGRVDNTWIDGLDKASTENGNHIIDLFFDRPLDDLRTTAAELESVRGLVAHGLVLRDPKFKFIVGTENGVRITGQGGEKVWWKDMPTRRNLIDNVLPMSPSWP